MIVSHTHRLIFVKTKKTAGTSIEVYLAARCGPGDVVTPVGVEEATEQHEPRNYRGTVCPVGEFLGALGAGHEWRDIAGAAILPFGHALKRKRFYNHIPAFRASRRLGAETWRDYLTVCVERNPWDKALSQFYWKKRRRDGYTFAEFVREGDVGVNWPRYCHPRSRAPMVDHIIYFHELTAGLGALFERVGIDWGGSLDVRAKAVTRTERRPYQELFAGELCEYRADVDRLFATEIAMHGWDFDSGLPHSPPTPPIGGAA